MEEKTLVKNKEELENLKDTQKVCYICQNCKKLRTQYVYSLKLKPENLVFCPHCNSAKTAKETFKQKYGVSNPNKLKSIIEKRKKTNLKKYGVEVASQSEQVKKKHNQTLLERYGRLDVSQFGSKEHTKSMIDKYGVDNPQKVSIYREKTKQTNLKKYGVETPLQSKDLREKGKLTSLKHFGTEFPTQSKIIREKTEKTNLEKYGTRFASQAKCVKEKVIKIISKNTIQIIHSKQKNLKINLSKQI